MKNQFKSSGKYEKFILHKLAPVLGGKGKAFAAEHVNV